MEYRKTDDTLYIRIDKGEKLMDTIRQVCKRENILAGHFHGIGACDVATILTYSAKKQEFTGHDITGMLEVVSLMGNVTKAADGQPLPALPCGFSYLDDRGEIAVTAGHLGEATICFTGEIVLTPAPISIDRMYDPRAGIDVWKLS